MRNHLQIDLFAQVIEIDTTILYAQYSCYGSDFFGRGENGKSFLLISSADHLSCNFKKCMNKAKNLRYGLFGTIYSSFAWYKNFNERPPP